MTESFCRARMAAATLALTACLSLGAFAGPALAATVRANVSIAGAGMVTGPQSDRVNTNQNDRIVKSDCDQQVVVNDPLPVDATMTLTAAPSNFPTGQWKLVRWEGCASTSGATCTVTGPAFSSKTW